MTGATSGMQWPEDAQDSLASDLICFQRHRGACSLLRIVCRIYEKRNAFEMLQSLRPVAIIY